MVREVKGCGDPNCGVTHTGVNSTNKPKKRVEEAADKARDASLVKTREPREPRNVDSQKVRVTTLIKGSTATTVVTTPIIRRQGSQSSFMPDEYDGSGSGGFEGSGGYSMASDGKKTPENSRYINLFDKAEDEFRSQGK
jgi:hypothetical protein